MSEEILINVTPVETRVALVENGMLQEAYIERASRESCVAHHRCPCHAVPPKGQWD